MKIRVRRISIFCLPGYQRPLLLVHNLRVRGHLNMVKVIENTISNNPLIRNKDTNKMLQRWIQKNIHNTQSISSYFNSLLSLGYSNIPLYVYLSELIYGYNLNWCNVVDFIYMFGNVCMRINGWIELDTTLTIKWLCYSVRRLRWLSEYIRLWPNYQYFWSWVWLSTMGLSVAPSPQLHRSCHVPAWRHCVRRRELLSESWWQRATLVLRGQWTDLGLLC